MSAIFKASTGAAALRVTGRYSDLAQNRQCHVRPGLRVAMLQSNWFTADAAVFQRELAYDSLERMPDRFPGR